MLWVCIYFRADLWYWKPNLGVLPRGGETLSCSGCSLVNCSSLSRVETIYVGMPIGAILIWVLFRLPCCGDSMGVASQIPGAFNLMADTLKPLACTILPPLLPWCSPSLKCRSCIGGGSIGAQPKLEFKAVRLQTQFLSACNHISGIYWKSLSCYTREIRLFSLKCPWLCMRSPEELKTEYILVLHTSVPSSEHRQSVKGGKAFRAVTQPIQKEPFGAPPGFLHPLLLTLSTTAFSVLFTPALGQWYRKHPRLRVWGRETTNSRFPHLASFVPFQLL